MIAGLSPGLLGLDTETRSKATNGASRPWVKVTKTGRRAVHQGPAIDDGAGLDPLRGRVRLVQIFDPDAATVYIIDLDHVPAAVLKPLEGRTLAIHAADFDVMMLAAAGVHLRRPVCTKQLARLALGAERGGLSLAEVAAEFLDLDLPKAEQVSDWAAARLSASQLGYAAVDAAVAQRLVAPIWGSLDAGARQAFKNSGPTVVPVAAMRLAGIPFSRAHKETVAEWEQAYTAGCDRFIAITGEEIPPQGPRRSAWLEQRMPADTLAWWPRTDTGQLRMRGADLERLAALPEIRPLLDVIHWDKRLRAFGHALLAKVGADGRLRMNLQPAAAKTGRATCTAPNLQQLPQDVRKAVRAAVGRVLVPADYRQIEFRCAAELSGDAALRQIFRDNLDLHVLNAEDFIGASLASLPAAEQEITRSKAKRIGFGVLYGSGAAGLVASAWNMYRIEMPIAEAEAWKERFYSRYPQLRAWQRQTADEARVTGVLRSAVGRPLRAAWEPIQPLKWTLCCNYPVQSSAADVLSLAMTRVHRALAGLDAKLILQIHDELLVECAEDIAEQVKALMTEHMTAAWLAIFPGAPASDLVDVASRPCWAKPKAKT